MSIGQCSKGTTNYTLIGQDENQALAAQDNFAGEGTVCFNPGNKSYYYLEGAPSNGAAASSSDTGTAGLKHDIDKLRSEISSLLLEIQRDQQALESMDGSHGFLYNLFHNPTTLFFGEALGLTAMFGLAVPFVRDLSHLLQLKNPAELLRRKNEFIKELGGCAPAPGSPAGSSKISGKWALAGLAAGGLIAYDAYPQTNGGNATSTNAPSLPPIDYSNMDEAGLHTLYDRLNQQYSDLVNQKVALETQIQAKGGQVPKETALDKITGSPIVKAATVVGVFGWAAPAWEGWYAKTQFHQSVGAAEQALNTQAEAQALQAIGTGQCSEETAPVAAKQPVLAANPVAEFSALPDAIAQTSLGEALTPTVTKYVWQYTTEIDGQIYAIDPAAMMGPDGSSLKTLSGGSWTTAQQGMGYAFVPADNFAMANLSALQQPNQQTQNVEETDDGYDVGQIQAVALGNQHASGNAMDAAASLPNIGVSYGAGGASSIVFAAPTFNLSVAPATVPLTGTVGGWDFVPVE